MGALWPPNPQGLLNAAFATRRWAVLNVKFSLLSISGSSVRWLIVGGTVSVFSASIAAIASIAPAGPKRRPVSGFVELILGLYAFSPNKSTIALVSLISPTGVDVPCTLI